MHNFVITLECFLLLRLLLLLGVGWMWHFGWDVVAGCRILRLLLPIVLLSQLELLHTWLQLKHFVEVCCPFLNVCVICWCMLLAKFVKRFRSWICVGRAGGRAPKISIRSDQLCVDYKGDPPQAPSLDMCIGWQRNRLPPWGPYFVDALADHMLLIELKLYFNGCSKDTLGFGLWWPKCPQHGGGV